MPDNEWARLTPGEAGDNAAWYRRLDSRHHHRPHCFEFGPSEHAPRPWNKGHRMSAAELAAIPAVAALVDAARMLARSAALSDRELDVVRQEWGNTNVEVLRHWRDRTLDTLAAFEADDDPDRPLEDDEFQCG